MNAELKEGQEHHQADIWRLNEELEERLRAGGERNISGEDKIPQVIDGMIVRLKAFETFLEVKC